jgi:phospholipase C
LHTAAGHTIRDAVAAALPQDLSRVLAIPANNRSGSIRDVEHVVFLMPDGEVGARGFASLPCDDPGQEKWLQMGPISGFPGLPPTGEVTFPLCIRRAPGARAR